MSADKIDGWEWHADAETFHRGDVWVWVEGINLVAEYETDAGDVEGSTVPLSVIAELLRRHGWVVEKREQHGEECRCYMCK